MKTKTRNLQNGKNREAFTQLLDLEDGKERVEKSKCSILDNVDVDPFDDWSTMCQFQNKGIEYFFKEASFDRWMPSTKWFTSVFQQSLRVVCNTVI